MLAFCADNTLLCVFDSGLVEIYSAPLRTNVKSWRALVDGSLQQLVPHSRRPSLFVALPRHASPVLVDSASKSSRIIDDTSDKPALCCAFSPDGLWLVLICRSDANGSKCCRVFDAHADFERRASRVFSRSHDCVSHAVVHFSHDSSRVFLSCGNLVSVVAVPSLDLIRHVALDRDLRDSLVYAFRNRAYFVGQSYNRQVITVRDDGDNVAMPMPEDWYQSRDDSVFASYALLALHDHVVAVRSSEIIVRRIVNLFGETTATSRLYAASLLVFRVFRRLPFGALIMQRMAEAVAGFGRLAPLTDAERTRIFTAARVTHATRVARHWALVYRGGDADEVELETGTIRCRYFLQQHHESATDFGYHLVMQWLREEAPNYTRDELAPLGPLPAARGAPRQLRRSSRLAAKSTK